MVKGANMSSQLLTVLSLALAAAGVAFVMQDDACQQINQPCPVKNAERGRNPPWFPSLMAFEHYDSGRTKLFERAHFAGSFERDNTVDVRISLGEYPTPYNVVYFNPEALFVF